jgi:hypothetical protein
MMHGGDIFDGPKNTPTQKRLLRLKKQGGGGESKQPTASQLQEESTRAEISLVETGSG